MKKGFWKKSLIGVVSGTMLFQLTAAADVDKLNISQIIQEGNDVYLYVSALDEAEKNAKEAMSAEQFSVTIDRGAALPVQDVAVYQTLDQGICYNFCIDISKSVTEEEMQEIKSSITAFVDCMGTGDYARIITIGSEITSVCDTTKDHNALKTAIDTVARTANDTYLYKGLSFALGGQKKALEEIPDRAAVILFTDGMDDSDGASSEEQVLIDIAETRIPVYVVGLKGQDSSANLNSVGQIARQSGGSVLSYNDMSITEAVQTVGELMNNTYQLHVLPAENYYGMQDLNWRVTYNPGNYSLVSSAYVYSLGMEGVEFVTEEPTEEPTETLTEEPTEALTEEPTEVPTEEITEIITEAVTEIIPETETETERSTVEKLLHIVQENIIIFVAAGLIWIALVILVLTLLRKKKSNDFEFEYEDPISDHDDYEKTLDETAYDDERTIDEKTAYDDEETIYETEEEQGMKLEFDITFDGITQTEQRVLKEQLILGRGSECDVDVVLNSNREERKQTSRKHAFIIEHQDGLYVKDNSKNKTYLNGIEIMGETALKDGDVLQLGRATVMVKILKY